MSSLSNNLSFNEKIEKDINQWLESRCGVEKFRPGLERILPFFSPILAKINKQKVKIITIGGTNGKGETAHSLDYLLNCSQKKIALWTSPHILSITERFRFNGKDITANELFSLMVCHENSLIEGKFSYYEFLFYIFLVRALELSVDYMILEVGLGGRYDAVNLLDANIAILTSISREHQEILGKSYFKILHEKLPIARTNAKLVTSFELKYCRDLTQSYCVDNSIEWVDLFDKNITNSNDDFSKRNKNLANYVFNNYLLENMGEQRWVAEFPTYKGRFEKIIYGESELTFVGSHNIDGIRKLTEILKNQLNSDQLPYDQVVVAFSKRDINDIKIMLESLCLIKEYHSRILLTVFDHHKAFKEWNEVENFKSYVKNRKITFLQDWRIFFTDNKRVKSKILVTGSYYFIGEVQRNIINL